MGAVKRRALLINPPVYDLQYWAEWSLPHGLLKVGAFLKEAGYQTRLIDCLYADSMHRVSKQITSVVEIGRRPVEIGLSDFRREQGRLGSAQRFKYVFGMNLESLQDEIAAIAGMKVLAGRGEGEAITHRLFTDDVFHPDEVWITSIMTYWWESTVDVAELCKKLFPSARIRIGGIYPTLASDHLRQKLAERGLDFQVLLGHSFDLSNPQDLIVVGEIPEASWKELDLDLYFQPTVVNSRYYHGPLPGTRGYETAAGDRRFYGPDYSILTTTRGCPFNCAYCAQRAYNLFDNEEVSNALWTGDNGKHLTMRTRDVDLTLNEIRDKFKRYGIRRFAFYEDNFLVAKDHFRAVLQGVVDDSDLRGNLHLYAPEGIEVRLIDLSLARLMREAGFEKVYLPLENINTDVIRSWNRSHSSVEMFERSVENCIEAGFALRNMALNAFVLFGTPGEDIRSVVDSAIFASSKIGSVIPMLFTPVPGSAMYEEYRGYLSEEMGFDLQHLNGKLFPFFEFNRRRFPGLEVGDYLDLEAFMFRLNAQATHGTFDVGANSRVARTFRSQLQRIPR